MLFVDISGFTKMSERLARHGKVGAEEVTDAIGTCFEALLEIAYQAGGGLLKFGGDALLLLFTGDGHAERAAGSALGMQNRLADVGRLDTSAGRVVLRMSAGRAHRRRSSASSSASRTASCCSPAPRSARSPTWRAPRARARSS